MKKRVKRIKLNRRKVHSDAILRDLLYALITHGKVETVSARAKMLSRYADKSIAHVLSWGKDLSHNRVQTIAGNKRTAARLHSYCAFLLDQKDKKETGFTSVVRTRFRKGDNSEMAEVKLHDWESFSKKVDLEVESKKKKSKRKKRKKADVNKDDKKRQKGKKPGVEDKDGLISKLSGRILGRQSQDKSVKNQTRSRARSGL